MIALASWGFSNAPSLLVPVNDDVIPWGLLPPTVGGSQPSRGPPSKNVEDIEVSPVDLELARKLLPPIEQEYEGAILGDARLSKRLVWAGKTFSTNPSESFPDLAGSGLDATYQFFGNPKVTLERILEPHIQQTVTRCAQRRDVLLLSDSSEIAFSGKRKNTGRLSGADRGFWAHATLAASADGVREPLGVLHLKTWVRHDIEQPDQPQSAEERRRATNRRKKARKADPNKESLRWAECSAVAEARLPPHVSAIHVGDRESDDYVYFAWVWTTGHRAVLRLKHNRVLDATDPDNPIQLFSVMDRVQGTLFRDVPLSKRKADKILAPRAQRANPPRQARLATLHYSVTPIILPRPRSLKAVTPESLAFLENPEGEKVPRPGVLAELPDSLTVNVVRVWEPNPPPGEEPIEWRLITTEPIDTPEQIARVVDIYRARWLVESFQTQTVKTCSAWCCTGRSTSSTDGWAPSESPAA